MKVGFDLFHRPGLLTDTFKSFHLSKFKFKYFLPLHNELANSKFVEKSVCQVTDPSEEAIKLDVDVSPARIN